MNNKINIADILQDKPKDIKLYSPAFGDVQLDTIFGNKTYCIQVKDVDNKYHQFTEQGQLSLNGECVLFPSEVMQDWSKFTWKKGDVLYSYGTGTCIFDSWEDNDYALFKYKYMKYDDAGSYCGHGLQNPQNYEILNNKEKKSEYYKAIKSYFGGKLNLKTLEIEKPNPKFKDGDVVAFSDGYGKYNILVFERIEGNYLNSRTSLSSKGELMPCRDFCEINAEWSIKNRYLRLATEEEKQQLFTALEKENKAWNAEKKQIVDLPKKYEFKPMDWCLMRRNFSRWELCQFSWKYDGLYHSVGGCLFHQCIPYNDQTAHLLGTTDDWRGGEV